MEYILNEHLLFIISEGYLENLKQLSVKCDILFVLRIENVFGGKFDSKTIVLGEDKRFESIHHQLDVWHKSIKLTKKLDEVEIVS